jgi:hypothetical protein
MNHRFNGGRGFPIIPFVLGGIVGSMWTNNNNRYYPYPIYPYPVQYYPYPYYRNY